MNGESDKFTRETGLLSTDIHGNKIDTDLGLAVVRFLLQIADSDGNFCNVESDFLIDVICKEFELDSEAAQELMDTGIMTQANSDLSKLDLQALHFHYSKDQRVRLMGFAWRLITSDNEVVKEEAEIAVTLREQLGLTMEDAVRARKIALLSVI